MSTVGKCDLKDTADSKKKTRNNKKIKKSEQKEDNSYEADAEKESPRPCGSVDDNFSSLAKEIDENVKIMSFLEI